MSRPIYAGIGSRETPQHILDLMTRLAEVLASRGWILRSGGAEGADRAFENGWWNHRMTLDSCYTADDYECFLPWEGYNDHTRYSHDGANVLPSMIDLKSDREAETIAASIHPAWNVCKSGAKKMHTRNVFQILGRNLDAPVKMVVAYAKTDKNGRPQGGTATAINLAKERGIEVFNLYEDAAKERIEKWLASLTTSQKTS